MQPPKLVIYSRKWFSRDDFPEISCFFFHFPNVLFFTAVLYPSSLLWQWSNVILLQIKSPNWELMHYTFACLLFAHVWSMPSPHCTLTDPLLCTKSQILPKVHLSTWYGTVFQPFALRCLGRVGQCPLSWNSAQRLMHIRDGPFICFTYMAIAVL